MTETTTENTTSTETSEAEPAEAAQVEAAQGTQEASEGADTGETTNKAGREAAKYRRQLRETEAERDALAATVETAREIILNNHLSSQKIGLKAVGIKQLGHNTADIFNADLTINHTTLESTLKSIRDSGFNYSTSGIVSKSGTGAVGQGSNLSWGEAISGGK